MRVRLAGDPSTSKNLICLVCVASARSKLSVVSNHVCACVYVYIKHLVFDDRQMDKHLRYTPKSCDATQNATEERRDETEREKASF
jgi:hypothetical protein